MAAASASARRAEGGGELAPPQMIGLRVGGWVLAARCGFRRRKWTGDRAAATGGGAGTGALEVLAAAGGPPGALRKAGEAAEAAARARAARLCAVRRGSEGGREVVAGLDGLSCALCQCVDSLHLLQNTHSDPRVAAEAAETFGALQGLIHDLNVDRGLHASVSASVQGMDAGGTCVAGGGGEALRVGRSLLRDFERSGVHLPGGGPARAGALEARVFRAGASFQANLARLEALGRVVLSPRELAGLPEVLRKTVVESPTDGTRSLPGTPAALSATLKSVQEDSVRRRAYNLAGSTPATNESLLQEMLEARAEIANLLGCPSYAHLVLGSGEALAGTPEASEAFLKDLLLGLRPRADSEARKLLRLKSLLALPGGDPAALRPWDRVLLTSHAKAEACGIDAVELSQYLSLGNAFVGLALILERLMGIKMVEEQVPPEIAWAPGLRAFALLHPEEGRLGLVLMDLLPRKGKYPHSALFTLRSGRQLPCGSYQLPIVALVCSFHGCQPYGGGGPADPLLLPSELETLFHEFGHALHSTLSRSEFQHLSGTRGPKDFIEVPAKIFERYASCPKTLPLFAKHWSTGAALPQGPARALRRASAVFSALDLQQQALVSLMDLRYAGNAPPQVGDDSVFREFGSLEAPRGWELRFSHFVDYGAHYYSYLYARCLAEEFWREHCMEDPLGSAPGQALRSLLGQGCAGDSIALLKEVLGPGALSEREGGWAPSPEACLAALQD